MKSYKLATTKLKTLQIQKIVPMLPAWKIMLQVKKTTITHHTASQIRISLRNYIESPYPRYKFTIINYIASGVCNEYLARIDNNTEVKQNNTCYFIYFSILKTWALGNIQPYISVCILPIALTNSFRYILCDITELVLS